MTFFGGIILILFGYTFVGMIIECFGILNLFGSFFPMALAFLRQLPYIGQCLNLPVISTLADKIAGKRRAEV